MSDINVKVGEKQLKTMFALFGLTGGLQKLILCMSLFTLSAASFLVSAGMSESEGISYGSVIVSLKGMFSEG